MNDNKKNDKPEYTNFARISHTPVEFLIDYALLYPPVNPVDQKGKPENYVHGQIVSRVVMSPAHAKHLAAAITENVKQYEAKFGAIAEPPTEARSDITLN